MFRMCMYPKVKGPPWVLLKNELAPACLIFMHSSIMNRNVSMTQAHPQETISVVPVSNLIILAIIILFESPIVFSKCFVCPSYSFHKLYIS